ncbi:unnamed protein product [Lampetra planeri]
MDQQWRAHFKRETVGKLLALYFKDEKTKVNADALKLMTSLIRLFVTEAAMRAGRQAESEAVDVVDVAHLEKVLPQLVRDSSNPITITHTNTNTCATTTISIATTTPTTTCNVALTTTISTTTIIITTYTITTTPPALPLSEGPMPNNAAPLVTCLFARGFSRLCCTAF